VVEPHVAPQGASSAQRSFAPLHAEAPLQKSEQECASGQSMVAIEQASSFVHSTVQRNPLGQASVALAQPDDVSQAIRHTPFTQSVQADGHAPPTGARSSPQAGPLPDEALPDEALPDEATDEATDDAPPAPPSPPAPVDADEEEDAETDEATLETVTDDATSTEDALDADVNSKSPPPASP